MNGAGGMKSTFPGFGGPGGSGSASVLRNSGLRTSGVGGAGTSSIAFTPVQVARGNEPET